MVAGGTFADACGSRRRGAGRMAVRRGSRLDEHLLHHPWVSIALAGLVRVRDQRASLRMQPEPQGTSQILMPTKSEQRNLVWRYLWSTVLIAATVGVASVVARFYVTWS
jgi:hypothetical protein